MGIEDGRHNIEEEQALEPIASGPEGAWLEFVELRDLGAYPNPEQLEKARKRHEIRYGEPPFPLEQ